MEWNIVEKHLPFRLLTAGEDDGDSSGGGDDG